MSHCRLLQDKLLLVPVVVDWTRMHFQVTFWPKPCLFFVWNPACQQLIILVFSILDEFARFSSDQSEEITRQNSCTLSFHTQCNGFILLPVSFYALCNKTKISFASETCRQHHLLKVWCQLKNGE